MLKVNPITIGIFYRSPNENNLLNIFSNEFQHIDSKTNEIYVLGDFNNNLLENGKFILKENQSNKLKRSSSASVNKYKEFFQAFSLTEIIKDPTRITCLTSTLFDHILTNSSEKVSLKVQIDVGISDHQLIYCTRKIKRTKHNMHNPIQVGSLKKYSALKKYNALKSVQSPSCNILSNVNAAYSNFLNKISETIDSVAPVKEIRTKNNTQKWFDKEIAEVIKVREKYFKKFKKSNLQIDSNVYIEAKYNTRKLIKQKKIIFLIQN